MASSNHAMLKNLIGKIIAYAKKKLPPEQAVIISKFIRLFYAHSSPDDLLDRKISDLYGAAYTQWELMYHRHPEDIKVRVFNPHYEDNGWQSTHTIIEVAVADMPFVVDSLRMELNSLGITTHLMIFTGGIKVRRDKSGNIVDLLAYDSDDIDAFTESPIYLEIDRQTDIDILNDIHANLIRVLNDVKMAVEDWEKMQDRLKEILKELHANFVAQKKSVIEESIAFLNWLLRNHFTFLGARDYEVVGKDENLALRLLPESGLGVLRDETHSKVYRQFADLPDQARELMLSKDQILVISKTNTRSTVHRPAYTDYIGIKRFNEQGVLIGERRFIGLYTSTAYSSNPKEIPFVRKKVVSVLKKSGLPRKSHAGKDLLHILSTLPRDDLFQATVSELYELSIGILHLQERRRIRLFVRKDAYGRFISALVYIPRENFSTDLINRMQKILMQGLSGIEASFTTHFSESILARIHYIIRIDPKKHVAYDLAEIERQLIDVGKSWYDAFRETVLDYFGEERGNRIIARFLHAFPTNYREVFSPRNAIHDIERIEQLSEDRILCMTFYRPLGASRDVIKFKLFCADQTVPLSDALPMLENMGLRVIGEVPYQLTLQSGKKIWINDFSMTYAKEPTFEVEDVKEIFQESFYQIWLGEAENDTLNRLVLEAQLTYREIAILRAYTKYIRQTMFNFSTQYIAETCVNNPHIAKLLVELFKCHFDPERPKSTRKDKINSLHSLILQKLDEVAILDEDRILRRFLEIMDATLRTNYFQVDKSGKPKKHLSFKLSPKDVPDLPLPLPLYEIFVYSPRFEGIHLRADKVARGGIRWSDRREDFRTEVLGLMKAQQVKNAVIVPAGAKGVFVPKNLPIDGTREAVLEEGVTCYRGFIHGLLDLTDNLVDSKVIRPRNTICKDDADPYLVVAADKGTATFSDIANLIAIEKGFWLADAFASGGSTGYDHKKMGITARGAWVSAERHFQDLGINVDNSQITVVGIGDMSGDVFGNGLLMSPHMKLVAAFNHQHIFLDPNPSPQISYEERKRLFGLPRSSWDDYNRDLISKGGGVFPRTAKSIRLTPEVKQLLKINKEVVVPNLLIRSILKAPVDLIWNGGVGTFVKASNETHEQVGDRSNDALRVNAKELRARVVCEGGNLGLTQLARVEFEKTGGKINTDFIDNSGGVDCSDHEVNIKILLSAIVASGDLTEKQRNQLLARMTDEVSDLVLQNNYHQNQVLSVASHLSAKQMTLYIRYMEYLQETGNIDREIEFLPDDKELLERKAAEKGLTRPELAILLAYSKIILDAKIRKSKLIKDDYLSQYVKNAFPTPLRSRYSKQLMKHKLAPEIISTQLSNQLVSEMGITFIYQMNMETGASTSAIVRAYSVAREIFHLPQVFADIESLDYKIETSVQYEMYDDITRLVRRATRWFLRNLPGKINIKKTIDRYSQGAAEMYKRLPQLLLGDEKSAFEENRDGLTAGNVPSDIAIKLASVVPMYHALNIIEASITNHTGIYEVAKIYFTLLNHLDLGWFREQINAYPVESRWSVLAKAAYKGDLDWIQRELTVGVIKYNVHKKQIHLRIQAWEEANQPLIKRWQATLDSIKSADTKDLAILSVACRELSDLARMSSRNATHGNE